MQSINKSKLFAEIASTIERYVHQDSDRRILNSILNHTVAIFAENEDLQREVQFLKEENIRLRFLESMYLNLIQPQGKNIEILYKQTDSLKQ